MKALAQQHSGKTLDSSSKGRGFKSHQERGKSSFVETFAKVFLFSELILI
jgi:hypothetical protein